jgi:preprotein translocase subunit SecD
MNFRKNWRIWVLIIFVALSLLLVMTKGLSFGIEFMGGTEMKMAIEKGGEAYADPVVSILKNRLNGMGLRSVQVLKEADNRHITVKVSTTDPTELAKIKGIINQQAVFEQLVEGGLCARGSEIALDISQQGGSMISGSQWQVYVKTTGDAPARCGQVMKGKANHMTDIFLDRPEKAFILLDSDTCAQMAATDFKNHVDDTGYTQLSFIEKRALIPVVCYSASAAPQEANETLLTELGIEVEEDESAPLDLNGTVREMAAQHAAGMGSIILEENATYLPAPLRDEIASLNLSVRVYNRTAYPQMHNNYNSGEARADNDNSWIDTVTGLKSSLSISEGLTYGNPVYNSVFQGGSATVPEAKATAERFRIWLTSGNLPVKVDIVLERPNLPELGQQFMRYAILICLLAVAFVSIIIAIRYREYKIAFLITATSFSEVVILLGFASVAGWELDLVSLAGIIATLGTGVDHQIIITDETLSGERKAEKKGKVWDLNQAISRAFFIIFTSAATIIFAMLPIMGIVDLKGFALTTIVGVLIGIFITRPAFARIIEIVTERQHG